MIQIALLLETLEYMCVFAGGFISYRCDYAPRDCPKCHCRTTDDDGYKQNGNGGIFSSQPKETPLDQLALLLCLTCKRYHNVGDGVL